MTGGSERAARPTPGDADAGHGGDTTNDDRSSFAAILGDSRLLGAVPRIMLNEPTAEFFDAVTAALRASRSQDSSRQA